MIPTNTDDVHIIDLFFARSPEAIRELDVRYGLLCKKLARNWLHNDSDAQECVNDAYLALWNAIPPQRPDPLLPYVCRVTRNIAISRVRKNTAARRNAILLALDELAESIAAPETAESSFDAQELTRTLNAFLRTLETQDRVLFMRRYFFGDSVADAAQALSISRTNASVRLYRLRRQLRERLKEGGYCV